MEDVVVAKPKDPVAWLIETLEGSGKKPGDAELTRGLKAVLSAAPDNRMMTIGNTFPQYRRQITAALAASDGTLSTFKPLAAKALEGQSGPTGF